MENMTYIETAGQRCQLLLGMLDEAMQKEDWEKAASLIELNPEFIAFGLNRVYDRLPAEYKFSIPINCYTHHGCGTAAVRKYVRRARKLLPVERRIPAGLLALPEIVVYRAGAEPIDSAANRISWTTSLDVARWFFNRARLAGEERHIYKGIIRPKRVIWYTDDRQEKEILQYRGVRQITEIDPDTLARDHDQGRRAED